MAVKESKKGYLPAFNISKTALDGRPTFSFFILFIAQCTCSTSILPTDLPFEVHLHLPIFPLIFSIYQSFHMFLPDLFSIIHTSLRRATFIFEKVNLKTSRFSPVLCLAALKSSWPLWRESTFSTVSRTARSISFDAVQSNSLGIFVSQYFFCLPLSDCVSRS